MIELPPGYRARSARMEDVDGVTALIAACEAHDDGSVEIDMDDITSAWARPSFRPERDALVVTFGGVLAAWAEVFSGRRAEGDVHPGHRGRGLGSAILAWTERRAREADGSRVGQSVTDANVGAAELFRSNGYTPLWTSWILQIALGEDPPLVPAPPGIRLRAFERGIDEEPTYRVIEDAFAEWPDREPETFGNWFAWMIEHGAFSPSLSRLAVDGDRIVGAALALDYGVENEGWVQQLAVDAAYRRRGIARALLGATFGAFRERGAAACGLSTDSRTGALGLYEKVGMRVRRSYTHWAKALAPFG